MVSPWSGGLNKGCLGVERPVRPLIKRLLELAGIEAEIQNHPTRFRPADHLRVCCDHAKIARKRDLGALGANGRVIIDLLLRLGTPNWQINMNLH